MRTHFKSLTLLGKANIYSSYMFFSLHTVNTILQINIQFTIWLQKKLNVQMYNRSVLKGINMIYYAQVERKVINPFWQRRKYQHDKHVCHSWCSLTISKLEDHILVDIFVLKKFAWRHHISITIVPIMTAFKNKHGFVRYH